MYAIHTVNNVCSMLIKCSQIFLKYFYSHSTRDEKNPIVCVKVGWSLSVILGAYYAIDPLPPGDSWAGLCSGRWWTGMSLLVSTYPLWFLPSDLFSLPSSLSHLHFSPPLASPLFSSFSLLALLPLSFPFLSPFLLFSHSLSLPPPFAYLHHVVWASASTC